MRSRHGSFETTIELEDEEFDVTVKYMYDPGHPGCMYLRNGDPGFPPEPAEIEIESVVDEQSNIDLLSKLSEQQIEGLIIEADDDQVEQEEQFYDDR